MSQLTTEQLVAYSILATMLYGCFFSGLGYYVATQKHREIYEGVAFALLLGPLGLVIVACLPTLAPKEGAQRGLRSLIPAHMLDEPAERKPMIAPPEDEQARRLAAKFAAEAKRYTDAEKEKPFKMF